MTKAGTMSLAVFLSCLANFAGAAAPSTYYVDAKDGNDGNTGTSHDKSWRTIEKINKTEFKPGDKILFAGGQTFKGNLLLTEKSSGAKDNPITISSSGKERATIDAGAGTAITLDKCKFVILKDLKLVGCGRKSGSDGNGVDLRNTESVQIDSMEASGFRLSGVNISGDSNTGMTKVYAHDNGSAGISVCGWDGNISKDVYIGYCTADNNAGDPKNLDNHSGNGIVVGGLVGCLIEFCEASNNGWDMPRTGNGPVGIWGWNCDRLIIQNCISHDNKSPGTDGGGFDLDGGCTNSILQYNLSFNNFGCGYLLCQYPEAPTWKNNIVRYNISFNDGSRNMQSGIGLWEGGKDISDALVYNNVIVNPKHAVFSCNDIKGIVYKNNIFISGEDILKGPLKKSRFENNLYWSSTGKGAICSDGKTSYKTLEEWIKATGQETVNGRTVGIFADPKLRLPENANLLPTDPAKLAEMLFFRTGPDSKSIGAAMKIDKNGGKDFSGKEIKGRNIGAFED
ncbi:MAG TPA: hypothetical protein DET40_01510 [Lentisphaeria bacterium]|nr:MAG: hypothetical protein A2X45_13215 [Lentisphaerae bacterium GWF2_50_93]HCE42210.1 hypothetical protein [Lentisphaeria bacterium]